VPTLDEVFGLADKGDFDFNLETKLFPDHPEYAPDPYAFAELIVSKVRRYKLEDRVIVQSFDFRSLLAVNELAPEIRLSALIENPDLDFLVAAVESRAGIVSPNLVLVHSDNVEAAHSAGLQVIPWTANTIPEWKTLIGADVDGIITDDPAALINYLRTS
jgi:glycerophosphoryl diester phosphodiesterase